MLLASCVPETDLACITGAACPPAPVHVVLCAGWSACHCTCLAPGSACPTTAPGCAKVCMLELGASSALLLVRAGTPASYCARACSLLAAVRLSGLTATAAQAAACLLAVASAAAAAPGHRHHISTAWQLVHNSQSHLVPHAGPCLCCVAVSTECPSATFTEKGLLCRQCNWVHSAVVHAAWHAAKPPQPAAPRCASSAGSWCPP